MLLPVPSNKKLVKNPFNDYPPNYPCPCEKNGRGKNGNSFSSCCGKKPHAPIPEYQAVNVNRQIQIFINHFKPLVEEYNREFIDRSAKARKAKRRKMQSARRRNR